MAVSAFMHTVTARADRAFRAHQQAKMTGWTVDNMLVLQVNNPARPMLDISYEDKYGLTYLPVPGYSATY